MGRIYLFLILLLAGCAEVAPLTGGDKDETAPKTVANSQIPPQGTTNFNGSELQVTFDEYIIINDPSSTASMNPTAGKISVNSNKKRVTIKWTEQLQPNTTYIIQLDGTIQDLNEKNDTIHQFVFSTGNAIDTLKLSGSLIDANSGRPLDHYTVGLYSVNDNPLHDKYTYAVQSNKLGSFNFSYLKNEAYQLFAFSDLNKDRQYTNGEPYAFATSIVHPGDTTPIALRGFKPRNPLNKLQVNLELPGLATCYGRTIHIDSLKLNQQSVRVIHRFSKDSIQIALPEFSSSFYQFIYSTDTVSKPITQSERNKSFTAICTNYKKALLPQDTIKLICPEIIVNVEDKISLANSKGEPIPFQVFKNNNQLFVLPDDRSTDKLQLKLAAGALQGKTNQSDSTLILVEPKTNADLCNLTIDCKGLNGTNWRICLMDGKTQIAQQVKQENDSTVVFNGILPSNYSLICFQDNNNNNFWDVGDYPSKQQPEPLMRFVINSKLRPNWDILEKLEIK